MRKANLTRAQYVTWPAAALLLAGVSLPCGALTPAGADHGLAPSILSDHHARAPDGCLAQASTQSSVSGQSGSAQEVLPAPLPLRAVNSGVDLFLPGHEVRLTPLSIRPSGRHLYLHTLRLRL